MSNRVAQKKVSRDDMGEYMYEEVEAPLPGTSAYKMMKHRASFTSAKPSGYSAADLAGMFNSATPAPSVAAAAAAAAASASEQYSNCYE